MSLRAVLVSSAVACALLPVAGAEAAERFVGIDVSAQLVTFTGQAGSFTARRLNPAAVSGAVIDGLHRLPDGRLVALDVFGRIYDVDTALPSLSVRYGGAPVAQGFGGRPTFAVSPDGISLLVAATGSAEIVNLATGTATPVVLPSYAAGGSGAGRAVTPFLDFLPSGALAGVDGKAPAGVVRQTALGGPLSILGGFPVALSGPTNFTLAPDGSEGWLVTRAGSHISRLVAVNPVTGTTDAPGITFADGFNAIVALGPTDTAVPPPTGSPAPTTGPQPSTPAVQLTIPPRQSAAGIASRRAIRLSATSSTTATITVVARLGSRVVARASRGLVAGRAVRLAIPTTRGAAALIRGSSGRTLRIQVVVVSASGRVSIKRSVRLGH